jgi:hypothetical protein
MDQMELERGIRRFLLIGICHGGTASFHTAGCDSRVSGVMVINGLTFHSGAVSALREHLERKAKMPGLADPKRWLRAIRGRMDYRRIARIVFAEARSSLAPAEVQAEIGQFWETYKGLSARGVDALFAYAPGDPGFAYYQTLLGSRPAGCSIPRMQMIREGDHTFTTIPGQQRLRETVLDWVLTGRGGPVNCSEVGDPCSGPVLDPSA